MRYIILVRNPSGTLLAITTGDDGAVKEYDTYEEAYNFSLSHMLCKAYGCGIVDPEV